MSIIPFTEMAQADREGLRPLREIGTLEKTQFWDMDEIMEALRIANQRGVNIPRLSPASRGRREGLAAS